MALTLFPGGSGGGTNQFMQYPALPGTTGISNVRMGPPGDGGSTGVGTGGGVGGSPGVGQAGASNWGNLFNTPTWGGLPPGNLFGAASPYYNKGSGIATEPLQFQSLAGNWANFLQSQVGQGTGANPLLQQLLGFYSGGGPSNIPGANTLETIANQGVSALPAWQAMVNAQQQNIAQNQAQLREQFASMGDLAGSPFGTAMSNYMQQTTADQNALLGQMQLQGILQGQLPAAENLLGGAGQFGQFGQTLLPAYNPLNQYIQQLSGQYAPMFQTKQGGGVLGALLPKLGMAAGAGIGAGMSGGATAGLEAALLALCHVAASFYGWDSDKTKLIQYWMLTQADPDIALYYFVNGERIAKTKHRFKFKPLFDAILGEPKHAADN